MDLNGDGIDDVITGDYTPGNVHFFEGTESGLKQRVVIEEVLEEEVPEVRNLEDGSIMTLPDMQRYMSTAHFADWDGDGDWDMIVGNVKGGVFLNVNHGTPQEYKFGRRVPLTMGGEVMKVQSKSDPLPVDWDGDGILDLLVGDESAGITFFRGLQAGALDLAPGVSVVSGKAISLEGGYQAVGDRWKKDIGIPGYRLRLAVADWNNDGGLDLLVGNCETKDGKTSSDVYLFLREVGGIQGSR